MAAIRPKLDFQTQKNCMVDPRTSEAVQEAGTRRVNHFTVGARHMNISMVFLTQIIFVTDEYFKQIS